MSRKGAQKKKAEPIVLEDAYEEDSLMSEAPEVEDGEGDPNKVVLKLPFYRDTNMRERLLGSLCTDESYLNADEDLRGIIRYFTYLSWKVEDETDPSPYKIDAVRKITNSVLSLSSTLKKKQGFKFALEKPWVPMVAKK